jgi:preprotein translocase subunit YajC
MIYLNLIIGFVFFAAFLMIFMSIVEGKIRDRQNEKIVWRIEEMDKIEKRDKVVTRTGGLAHDRNRTYSEIQKQNDSKTQ